MAGLIAAGLIEYRDAHSVVPEIRETVGHKSNRPPDGVVAFACGALSGVSIALVGHPFDTIKVRLQVQKVMPCGSSSSSAMGYLKLTMRHEGLSGLFKGIWPQIFVQMINTGLLFGLQVVIHGTNSPPVGFFQLTMLVHPSS
jgi:hypothetical protein